jgi:glutathione synthase
MTPVSTHTGAPHFRTAPAEERPLADLDVIWMRKDPPFDMKYVFATYLLDLVPPSTLVLNRPDSIRNCNEKMFAQQWPSLSPPTLVTREIPRIKAFAEQAPGDIVIKPWDGNGGRGVLVTRHGDPNLSSMLELLTAEQTEWILVQHYLPEIKKGDKRIILFDGDPVGWMLRVPGTSDHRGNMHVGATVEACTLTPRDEQICAALAPRLRELGLLFVGIDIIGDALTEINVTSPTGFREIKDLMGVSLEAELANRVERLVAQRRSL